jgi:phage baseplate assembly protein W
MSVVDEFLGRGARHPWSLSARGGIRETSGAGSIADSLLVILATQHGERVMRPDFGCDLRSLTFEPLNAATLNLARGLVQEGLSRWEPRVEIVDVDVRPAQARGELLIEVRYVVRATQDVETLVSTLSLAEGG